MTAYSVSGTPNPDCTVATTGDSAGEQDGYPFWQWTNAAGTWFLVKIGSSYYIAKDLNVDGQITVIEANTGPSWISSTLSGVYAPLVAATGNVTVAAIPAVYASLTINDGPFAGQYVVLKTG